MHTKKLTHFTIIAGASTSKRQDRKLGKHEGIANNYWTKMVKFNQNLKRQKKNDLIVYRSLSEIRTV